MFTDFNVLIKTVLDKKGEVQLHDIFLDGKWIGSRRTKVQAELEAEYAIKRHDSNP